MIEHDTIRLLRECDAGVKMGISSIDEVMDYAKDPDLRKYLHETRETHDKLQTEIDQELSRFHDDGKEPTVMAKSMAWIKTNVKLSIDESDGVIADLITDGCNMGVKSLQRYLNQYQAADEKSKDIAKRLISSEEKLIKQMKDYL